MSVMMKASKQFESPKLEAVKVGEGDYVLELHWENGVKNSVDLTEPIFALKHLRPLRNKEAFANVKVGEWGWEIVWEDDLDFSAETLWKMALEQKSSLMTASEFRYWIGRLGLTQDKAAEALGISKRSVAYYATGAQPISKLLVLALKGLEVDLLSSKTSSYRSNFDIAIRSVFEEQVLACIEPKISAKHLFSKLVLYVGNHQAKKDQIAAGHFKGVAKELTKVAQIFSREFNPEKVISREIKRDPKGDKFEDDDWNVKLSREVIVSSASRHKRATRHKDGQ